ncbi:FAD/NAD(P)-binding protein [Arthrobacter sp. N199823]|uniref:FAD/NAD(P)-binding protein n=1 Tax=Arthrobacter sp. N199823 TaxID=2058895 RepID=UPI0015E3844B|nr:FAD/NAD(P)-binding domain-containing protein [Arthrobacter sp. N199823]
MIRIAVVGGGPKSLFALLALHDRLPAHAQADISADVYDPFPPGSGSVWREDQPHLLRLNVNAGIVDASSTLNEADFAGWLAHNVPAFTGEKYPPRAMVGRYLREQFQRLEEHGNVAVTHAPHAVTAVDRAGAKWQVQGAFGSALYDEVLLATGHGLGDAELGRTLPGALNSHPLIGDYSSLTTADIGADSNLWIRGSALTAYDVALLLTEGRGGSWQGPTSGSTTRELRYIPSGREPRRITFASRSGLLMDPKSEAVPPAITACLDRFKPPLRLYGSHLRTAMHDVGQLSGLWVVLLRCAQECALIMGTPVSALALWRTALTGVSVTAGSGCLSGSGSRGPEESLPVKRQPADELRNSLLVNHCQAPVTTGWLWARIWSGLYADLIAVLDRVPKSVQTGQQFATVARNLERFAFGPPEITARKLLALFDAGILHMAADGEEPGQGAVLIDAVTPGPGVLSHPAPEGGPPSGLFAGLLAAGHIWVRAGERGVLTDPDGTCLARDGSRTLSLAAVGRPTEDPTLGHDTLNRGLHGEHQQWAQRIAARVTALESTPAQRPALKE